jgi:predicted amidophosphoribosyltransferase
MSRPEFCPACGHEVYGHGCICPMCGLDLDTWETAAPERSDDLADRHSAVVDE